MQKTLTHEPNLPFFRKRKGILKIDWSVKKCRDIGLIRVLYAHTHVLLEIWSLLGYGLLMNVQQRLRADKEFFKMQYNSIVIQLNAAVALLHKKCDFAKFTSVFAFKLNSDDKKTNLTSLLFVAYFRVRVAWIRILRRTVKLMTVNLTPPLEHAALIQLDLSLNTFF